ncbi:hypothetical protein EZS27_011640 [termite gut metagenome]|jgi:hypothetical protein|uniref:DUF4194 domain-containing protein n=1 Tax=termite gut metagenome TaxID=433724 RepID=A0A5J4S4R4_9ZZZZ
MENTDTRILPYAPVIVKLLQGAIYSEDKLWDELILHQTPIDRFFRQIGVELIVEEKDGYVFLRQKEDEEGKTIGLIRRMPLTYEQTLLCVLLREWLDEFEVTDTETRNLYITHKQFRERIEMFFKEKSNQAKLLRNLDTLIKDMLNLDFLKKIEDTPYPDERKYEVRRIIKSKITADKLFEFKQKLTNYESQL